MTVTHETKPTETKTRRTQDELIAIAKEKLAKLEARAVTRAAKAETRAAKASTRNDKKEARAQRELRGALDTLNLLWLNECLDPKLRDTIALAGNLILDAARAAGVLPERSA